MGLVGLVAARTLLLRRFRRRETVHDAVAALYDTYVGGLADWLLLGGVVAIGSPRRRRPRAGPVRLASARARLGHPTPGLDLGRASAGRWRSGSPA